MLLVSIELAYEDYRREELIGGKVVSMAPAASRHVLVSGNIFGLFHQYLWKKKCVPIADGMLVFLSDTEHYVPDFMVVCDPNKIRAQGVYGAPDLVVEVLSPSTARRDKWHKKNGYEAAGVPELWLVDPVNQSVEVYLLQEGRYVMDNLYTLFSQDDLEMMTEKERSEVVTEFKCHLFDDFTLRLEDVFRPWF